MHSTLLHDAPQPGHLESPFRPALFIWLIGRKGFASGRQDALPKIVLHSIVCFWLDKQFLPHSPPPPFPPLAVSIWLTNHINFVR